MENPVNYILSRRQALINLHEFTRFLG
jgi:hypothetical protein